MTGIDGRALMDTLRVSCRSAAVSRVEATTVVFALLFATGVSSMPGTDFHTPSTISSAAGAVLSRFTPQRDNRTVPNDVESAQAFQAETEVIFSARNVRVVEDFQPRIERRELRGVPVLEIEPKNWNGGDQLLVHLHGGAYVSFSANSSLSFSVPLAAETGWRVVAVDYTLAPLASWNEIIDEVISVVMALVDDDGASLDNIAIFGESAGGSLAAGAVLKMRDQGFGMPAALALSSPWSDITETGDTYFTLRDNDPILTYKGSLEHAAQAYADPKDQKNPYVSPVYGDYSLGFPPTLIQVGTKEIFLSNAVRHYRALHEAGVEVAIDPYEGMWHVFQGVSPELPESKLHFKNSAKFLMAHVGKTNS